MRRPALSGMGLALRDGDDSRSTARSSRQECHSLEILVSVECHDRIVVAKSKPEQSLLGTAGPLVDPLCVRDVDQAVVLGVHGE